MDLTLVKKKKKGDSELSCFTEGHFIFLCIPWRQNITSMVYAHEYLTMPEETD